jgi:hypothetical protein
MFQHAEDEVIALLLAEQRPLPDALQARVTSTVTALAELSSRATKAARSENGDDAIAARPLDQTRASTLLATQLRDVLHWTANHRLSMPTDAAEDLTRAEKLCSVICTAALFREKAEIDGEPRSLTSDIRWISRTCAATHRDHTTLQLDQWRVWLLALLEVARGRMDTPPPAQGHSSAPGPPPTIPPPSSRNLETQMHAVNGTIDQSWPMSIQTGQDYTTRDDFIQVTEDVFAPTVRQVQAQAYQAPPAAAPTRRAQFPRSNNPQGANLRTSLSTIPLVPRHLQAHEPKLLCMQCGRKEGHIESTCPHPRHSMLQFMSKYDLVNMIANGQIPLPV